MITENISYIFHVHSLVVSYITIFYTKHRIPTSAAWEVENKNLS